MERKDIIKDISNVCWHHCALCIIIRMYVHTLHRLVWIAFQNAVLYIFYVLSARGWTTQVLAERVGWADNL